MNLPDDVIARLDAAIERVLLQHPEVRAGDTLVVPPQHHEDIDPNRALHSFYGRGNDARPGARPQEILTPQCVVDALAKLWPEGVALDPCSAPSGIINPERVYWVPGVSDGKKTRYPAAGYEDGLTLPWRPRTYVNPPFEHLQEWLEKAAGEPREQVILAPVRTHRKWFRKAMIRSNDVIWLDGSFKFRGYDQTFPAPLCILYRGDRDVAEAFKALGEPA